jgi:hypothetical protein
VIPIWIIYVAVCEIVIILGLTQTTGTKFRIGAFVALNALVFLFAAPMIPGLVDWS